MDRQQFSRRGCLRAAAVGSLGALSLSGASSAVAASTLKEIKIAGYAYDRVRAIQDGRLDLDGYDLRFQPEDIYTLNRLMFGPKKTYDVSETGLIPFVTRFANEDFRAYTLIPVFISRTFRHRNIFVRSDSGIEKPEEKDLQNRGAGCAVYQLFEFICKQRMLLQVLDFRVGEQLACIIT